MSARPRRTFSRAILRRRLGAALAVLPIIVLLGAADAAAQGDPAEEPAFDLTGEWILNTMSPNGAGTRDVTFLQDGYTLTGEIASSMAVGDLEGSIDGTTVSFLAVVFMESGPFEISYEATYEDGELKDGTIDFGTYGTGTFTGHRKPESGGR